MAKDFDKIRNGINLGSLSSDPSPANAGDIYFNSTSNTFRTYNGTAWSDIGTGSGGGTGVVDTDWVATSPVITATSSNPTFGTLSINTLYWRRVGDSMECRLELEQTTAGTNGAGVYLIQIPAGYSIDTTKTQATGSGNINAACGSANVDAITSVVTMWDTTHVFIDIGSNVG